MEKDPRYPKLIHRESIESNQVRFGEMVGTVEYTGDWEAVEGGKGVTCRTWKLGGVDADVDGADIKMEKGGYTPLQLVKSAEVVVDAPETGEVISVVLDPDTDEVYVNYFDKSNPGQLVYTEGMIVTLISRSDARFTEFESPSFHDGMFDNIPEGATNFSGRDLTKFNKIVSDIREQVQ